MLLPVFIGWGFDHGECLAGCLLLQMSRALDNFSSVMLGPSLSSC
jgi:hypothetical protein